MQASAPLCRLYRVLGVVSHIAPSSSHPRWPPPFCTTALASQRCTGERAFLRVHSQLLAINVHGVVIVSSDVQFGITSSTVTCSRLNVSISGGVNGTG